MSADNVTPIRPRAADAPPTKNPKTRIRKKATSPHPVDFEDALTNHLEQARGICDLVTAIDEHKYIAPDSIAHALDSAVAHIAAAQALVEKLYAAIRGAKL